MILKLVPSVNLPYLFHDLLPICWQIEFPPKHNRYQSCLLISSLHFAQSLSVSAHCQLGPFFLNLMGNRCFLEEPSLKEGHLRQQYLFTVLCQYWRTFLLTLIALRPIEPSCLSQHKFSVNGEICNCFREDILKGNAHQMLKERRWCFDIDIRRANSISLVHTLNCFTSAFHDTLLVGWSVKHAV